MAVMFNNEKYYFCIFAMLVIISFNLIHFKTTFFFHPNMTRQSFAKSPYL